MEIEKKYLVRHLPEGLENYPSRHLVQSYISRSPVIRLRKIEEKGQESFVLTVKGAGLSLPDYLEKVVFLSVREEFELDLTREQYERLRAKEEGRVLEKTRYLIPLENTGCGEDKLTAELDVFHGELSGLILVEVEFGSTGAMEAFVPPEWFGEDVSDSDRYHNSTLSR